jgi:hypothetical protein
MHLLRGTPPRGYFVKTFIFLCLRGLCSRKFVFRKGLRVNLSFKRGYEVFAIKEKEKATLAAWPFSFILCIQYSCWGVTSTPRDCARLAWVLMIWGLTRIALPRGPLRAGRPLRGEYTGFALGLPMVGAKILHRDQRKRQPKGYTSHEVTALRAGGPAGRPCLSGSDRGESERRRPRGQGGRCSRGWFRSRWSRTGWWCGGCGSGRGGQS